MCVFIIFLQCDSVTGLNSVMMSFVCIHKQVADEGEFKEKLGCGRNSNSAFKVVSIFGNTGDGKSHTLNHTFFGGQEVFKTSTSQSSCTLGVWCSLDKQLKAVIMDTEGLLGSSSNENQRTRLLLKVLAVSDIVIYRTRAERLHTDMFVFLSNASKAYLKHFKQELRFASQKYGISESDLGPTLVVFQETAHTDILGDKKGWFYLCNYFHLFSFYIHV